MNLVGGLELSRRRRLPVILAAESAECGLACIAMIANYHGQSISLNGLRQRHALSLAGVTLRGLMQLADGMGFGTRALRIELEDIDKLVTPAILHWDLNHFVVLKGATRQTATIHDPATGAKTLSIAELSRHFTGVALEVTPTQAFARGPGDPPLRVQDLWSRAHGLGAAVFQILLLSVAMQCVAFAAPFQLQLVVDEAIGRSDVTLLNVIALAFLALVLLHAVMDGLRAWLIQVFGNQLIFQLVANLFHHLLRLPAPFFEKRHVGDIMSRMASTTAIQEALTKGLVSTVVDGLMAVIAVIFLYLYSPKLATIVVLAVVINGLFAASLLPLNRARAEEQLVASALERTHLMESIRAVTTIKLMGREGERESVWRNLYAKVVRANFSLAKFEVARNAVSIAVLGVSLTWILYLGAQDVIAGAGLSIGMLVAFLSFRQTFNDRLESLIKQAVQLKLLGVHIDRLGDLVEAKPELDEGPPLPTEVLGGLSVRNVAFRYADGEPWVLRDFNLEIRPGEFLAICGRSGGGKTTLLKLMLGLQPPVEGDVLLDGARPSPAMWRAWRRSVGVVAQDDKLLSGSIAENIAFFDPDLDMAAVHLAASAAQVHDDIMRMPMQYLSLVGDMGSTLSGGQRQRVLLARALYRQPKILLMDEGTANLDEASEQVIAAQIAGMSITRIVIAHRPALLGLADRVIQIG